VLHALVEHSGVTVMPDGKRAVSASRDKKLKLWDLETGRELRTLPGHADYCYVLAVTPDGTRAVSASGTKHLRFGTWRPAVPCTPWRATLPMSMVWR